MSKFSRKFDRESQNEKSPQNLYKMRFTIYKNYKKFVVCGCWWINWISSKVKIEFSVLYCGLLYLRWFSNVICKHNLRYCYLIGLLLFCALAIFVCAIYIGYWLFVYRVAINIRIYLECSFTSKWKNKSKMPLLVKIKSRHFTLSLFFY